MENTFYAVPEGKYDRFVTMHHRVDGSLKEQPKPAAKDQPIFIAGDGGLRSTAADYVTFLQMLLHKGTLHEAKLLHAKQRSRGSYSWSGLFNTHFWVDPQNEIAAVILMQVLPFYDAACIRTLQGFEERIYGGLK
jgi:CubicO group peptidase (beta-lactamase class C family)